MWWTVEGKGNRAGQVKDCDENEEKKDHPFYVKIEDVIPNPSQPRKTCNDEKLRELAASIKMHGIIQPPVVVRKGDKYQLVVGERRWKAAKQAGVKEIPVIVREVEVKGRLEIALVENLHREDLNPIEEAMAFSALVEEYHYSQEQLSERVGRSRSSVANTLRLLNLPPEIQNDIAGGALSQGHGRAILSLEDRARQMNVREKILRKALSVRQTEELVRTLASEERSKETHQEPEARSTDIEQQLRSVLGTRVVVRENKKGRGRIEIHFSSLQDFERLSESLILNIPRPKKYIESFESSLL